MCIYKITHLKHRLFIITVICLLGACDSKEQVASNNDSEVLETEVTEQLTYDSTDIGLEIVNYANSLLGTPYKEAGRDSTGFDCSGFVYYVFRKYNIEVPHSSRHLAKLGIDVAPDKAKPGDLVLFRGTNPISTEVGHVGIVITSPGEPIKFIHASSAESSPYVKYDSLAKANYNRRFIKIKRVLQNP